MTRRVWTLTTAAAAAAAGGECTDIAAAAAVAATTTWMTRAMTTVCLTCVVTGPSFVALAVDAIRATHYSGNASNFDGDRHSVALTQVNDTY